MYQNRAFQGTSVCHEYCSMCCVKIFFKISGINFFWLNVSFGGWITASLTLFLSVCRVLYGNKIAEIPKGLFDGLVSLQLLWVPHTWLTNLQCQEDNVLCVCQCACVNVCEYGCDHVPHNEDTVGALCYSHARVGCGRWNISTSVLIKSVNSKKQTVFCFHSK